MTIAGAGGGGASCGATCGKGGGSTGLGVGCLAGESETATDSGGFVTGGVKMKAETASA